MKNLIGMMFILFFCFLSECAGPFAADGDTYKVTFISLGGSLTPEQSVISGGLVTTSPIPTREGYTFGGWYKTLYYTEAWNFATNTITTNTLLYPKWTKINPETFLEADRPQVTIYDAGVAYKDWFFPSLEELRAMRTILASTAADRTTYSFSDANYWSSSEVDSSNASYILFTDGTQGSGAKSSQQCVRGARSFTSETVYQLKSKGPTDGWIFHIINNGNGTYTYYECSPKNFYTNIWCSRSSTLLNTETAIGTGKTNTEKINSTGGYGAASNCKDAYIRPQSTKTAYPYYYGLKLPWNYNKAHNSTRKYPMYIAVHSGGADMTSPTPPTDYPCFVLSPKLDDAAGTIWSSAALAWFMPIIEKVEQDYRVDKNRLFIGGFSQGGAGSWQIANALYAYNGQVFASISRAAGGSYGMDSLPAIAYGQTSVNLRIGLGDWIGTVTALRTAYNNFKNSAYNAGATEISFSRVVGGYTGNVRLIVKNGIERARITEFPDMGHNDVYDSSQFPWFYEQSIEYNPIITSIESFTKFEGEKVEFDVTVTDGNDTDIITLTPSGMPDGSELNKISDRTWRFTWQTDFNDAGGKQVIFKANDGKADSNPITATITVTDVSTNLRLMDHKDWN